MIRRTFVVFAVLLGVALGPVVLGLGAAGCSIPAAAPAADGGMPDDAIQINGHPTGSIQVPSLCERTSVDLRVSFTGVSAFSVLWNVDHYEVVYADLVQRDIFVVHLAQSGAMLDAPIAVDETPGDSSLPTILATKTGYVVAWQELDTQATVRVHALDLSGRPVGGSHTVATGRSAQMRPVLSQSPLGVAISWMDQAQSDVNNLTDVGDSTTYIALLDDDLRVRADLPPHRVNPTARAGYPWLAGDAAQLALLWSDDTTGRTDTYFSPIDAELRVPDPINVRDPAATNAALLGRLALTDFGFLASWEDLRTGQAEIYMALLDPSGNRYAGGIVEEPDTGNANWPHIAWTGSAAGIAYYQFRAGKPQVFMTFIDQNGTRIEGAADAQISNTPASARYPDLVWNGNEFGVLWIDSRDDQTELYFNRLVCKKPAPI